VAWVDFAILLRPASAQSHVQSDIKHDTPEHVIPHGESVHVDVELALVNVTVTDPYNRLVTGLEVDNFRVFEDNVEQEVVNFSSEDVPISIGVILDLSGSMFEKQIPNSIRSASSTRSNIAAEHLRNSMAPLCFLRLRN